MKGLFTSAFAFLLLLLHSKVAMGLDPTYDELLSQLPITLQPNGDDQFFFFIVPVQKSDDANVILQMAQAQDQTPHTNGSLSSTKVNTKEQSINMSSVGVDDMDLDEVFSNQPDFTETGDFNFQVPVIVPLDFRFRYDGATASVALPQCTVDTRTWKENIITKIANTLNLEGCDSWDHADLTKRIRLRKDVLTSITLAYITDTDQLSRFVSTILQTKFLTDMRYNLILTGVTELTADYVALISEGVDTYQLIVNTINLSMLAADALAAADAANQAVVTVEKARIDMISAGVTNALNQFKDALVVVKNLQVQRDREEAENMMQG